MLVHAEAIYTKTQGLIAAFVAMVFVCAVIIPASVQAGVFSLMGAMPDKQDMYAFDVEYTAQNMPLLRAALHSDPNPAKGGGDILVEDGALVPGADISGDSSTINTKTAGGEISVYVVREGDTLSEIAGMFGVSAKTILWANDIKDARVIRPGAALVILPITGVRHVVKGGDTIQAIAKKYDGDVDDILAYNQLASASEIHVGDVVVIPDGVMSAPAPSKTSVARGGSSVSGGGSSSFTHPVPGSIKTQGIHGYNGVDFGAPVGTPVLAAAGGSTIVAKGSGWNGGYGLYVVIKHPNGTQTLYAHLSSVAIGVGDTVSAGEVIGYVGSTGRSTGAHLHFEVRGARNPF